MPQRPLILPDKSLIYEFITGYYPMEDYSWTRRPTLATTSKLTPIAWTLYQQAIFNDPVVDDNTEQDFIDAGYAHLVPDTRYGRLNTLIRKPKTILLDVTEFFGTPGTANYIASIGRIFDPIAAALTAKHVVVMDNHEAAYFGNPRVRFFNSFLPPTGEDFITDEFVEAPGGLGSPGQTITTDFNHQAITPSNWIGGEILFLGAITSQSSGQGIGTTEYNAVQNDFTTRSIGANTNNNNYDIANIQACYPRYERFRYHVVYHLSTPADDPFWGHPAAPGTDVAFYDFTVGVWNSVIAATTAYGVTGLRIDGAWDDFPFPADRLVVEASFQNAIIEFFDL